MRHKVQESRLLKQFKMHCSDSPKRQSSKRRLNSQFCDSQLDSCMIQSTQRNDIYSSKFFQEPNLSRKDDEFNKVNTRKTFVLINNFYIDFNALARHNHELYQHLVILDYKTTINFKRQDSLIILTKSIMQQLFQMNWDCPINNLCPRIPNRMNYLLWLNHYLLTKQSRIKQNINIIDIGTGATCIYPLLGVRLFSNWSFIGLQSNKFSAEYAQKLVDLNKLNDRIKIIQSSPNSYLLGVVDKQIIAELCICNPPFFQTQSHYRPVGKMLENQYETEGGEYQFFFEIFRQSFHYNHLNWFTCMMGTKKGYYDARDFLAQENGITLKKYSLGEIKQGNISRYILAWQPKRS